MSLCLSQPDYSSCPIGDARILCKAATFALKYFLIGLFFSNHSPWKENYLFLPEFISFGFSSRFMSTVMGWLGNPYFSLLWFSWNIVILKTFPSSLSRNTEFNESYYWFMVTSILFHGNCYIHSWLLLNSFMVTAKLFIKSSMFHGDCYIISW